MASGEAGGPARLWGDGSSSGGQARPRGLLSGGRGVSEERGRNGSKRGLGRMVNVGGRTQGSLPTPRGCCDGEGIGPGPGRAAMCAEPKGWRGAGRRGAEPECGRGHYGELGAGHHRLGRARTHMDGRGAHAQGDSPLAVFLRGLALYFPQWTLFVEIARTMNPQMPPGPAPGPVLTPASPAARVPPEPG